MIEIRNNFIYRFHQEEINDSSVLFDIETNLVIQRFRIKDI